HIDPVIILTESLEFVSHPASNFSYVFIRRHLRPALPLEIPAGFWAMLANDAYIDRPREIVCEFLPHEDARWRGQPAADKGHNAEALAYFTAQPLDKFGFTGRLD